MRGSFGRGDEGFERWWLRRVDGRRRFEGGGAEADGLRVATAARRGTWVVDGEELAPEFLRVDVLAVVIVLVLARSVEVTGALVEHRRAKDKFGTKAESPGSDRRRRDACSQRSRL